ncbi:hypothetical protein N482_02195 [Pseudoalteromonas luteoviolacea NCIMB 1942]|uniref:Uncharacterized protein n=1 Tax=Pseudoalteromonas luteoviolacea NCIMB 1942 TaxID=1365253 RepID=A0A167BYS2_9GAMM|nr:hypothetical protein N482_02195 [Pseudoalteromonas luteoviolacea NCIMB 1942]
MTKLLGHKSSSQFIENHNSTVSLSRHSLSLKFNCNLFMNCYCPYLAFGIWHLAFGVVRDEGISFI